MNSPIQYNAPNEIYKWDLWVFVEAMVLYQNKTSDLDVKISILTLFYINSYHIYNFKCDILTRVSLDPFCTSALGTP